MLVDNDPIVIVGMGIRAPESSDLEAFWSHLEQKHDLTRDIPNDRFNTDFWCSKEKVKGCSISSRCGIIDNITEFDAPFFNLSVNEAKELDPQIRLLLETAWYAIEDAGIVLGHSTEHGGVFIGHMTHDYMEILSSSRHTINSHCMQGNAETMAANRLSFFFNLTGPSITYNTACSSSLVAIHGAVQAIQSGECDWALAGGANALLDPRYFVGFTDWGTMSPDGHSFSFDSRANGYVRCEGAGMVVLKCLSRAKADGDRIYALIRGCGINHDGAKPAITNPRGFTQQILLEKVCRESGTDPSTIAYVEAHGTGTAVGDKTEAFALSSALCKEQRSIPLFIGSLKSNFGHMEGAAGVASLIKGALCIHKGMIPATIKVEVPNPAIQWKDWQLQLPLDTIPFPCQENEKRRVVVSSFGIGGTNACFILEQTEQNEPSLPPTSVGDFYILLWTAKSDSSLHVIAKQILKIWKESTEEEKHSICWTLLQNRTWLSERACIVGSAYTIETCLVEYINNKTTSDLIRSTSLDSGKRPICFVFCGQGAQWIKMGEDCMNLFPVYNEVMMKCASIVKRLGNWDLIQAINSEEVNTTRVSQPATTAVQLALVELLKSWGIVADGVIGHSSGEIAAAFAAGAITLEEAMEVAFYRGSTIDEYSKEQGGMAAVGLTEEQLLPYLQKYDKLVIACYNSPTALTVSGDSHQIDMLCSELKLDGLFCRRLVVTHAFHSPYMHSAMPAYQQSISNIQGTDLVCSFFSSLRGCQITDGTELNASYFVENLTHPVLFPNALQSLFSTYPSCCFIEIGPHPTLQRPILQTLSNAEGLKNRVFGSLDRRIPSSLSLSHCICSLACAGADVHSSLSIFCPESTRYLQLPHYPFDRKPLWFESEQSYRFRCPAYSHPLLGVHQMAPLPTWDNDLLLETIPWVQDHVISDSCLAPGALYLDMAITAACSLFSSTTCCLLDCCFLQAFVLPSKGHILMRTTANPENGEILIYHRDAPEDVTMSFKEPEEHRWILHFRCFSRPELETVHEAKCSQVISEATNHCKVSVNVESLYHRIAKQGLLFGPCFQSLESIQMSKEEGICHVKSSTLGITKTTNGHYSIHPVLLDTIFQSLISLLGDSVGGCIPIAIQSLNYHPSIFGNEDDVYVYTKRIHQDGFSNCGDVWMVRNNHPCISCRGVQVIPLSHKSHKQSMCTIQYREFLLQDNLDSNKQFSFAVIESSSFQNIFPSVPSVSQDDLSSYQHLSLLWGIDLKEETLIETYQLSLYPLVRSLLSMKDHLSSLVVITRGALIDSSCPVNCSILGFMRSLHTELPTLPLWVIDMSEDYQNDIENVLKLLSQPIRDYREIAIRGNHFYEPQVVETSIKQPLFSEPAIDEWSLLQHQEGSLDSFQRTELHTRPMTDEDIVFQVHYAGLNYKDVMIAVGLLKEDAFAGGRSGLSIGLEASGIVTQVGKKVTHVKVGDEVFGLLDHGLATHSTSEGCFICKKPPSISMQQAAAIFVPYTTAYATIISLGKAKKGQIILIHGAAGGVGSAAIQLAHSVGATVIATVSNKKKEEYVRELGADYVFNSRSCQFVNEIMSVTNYHGCDVILNCLSGRSMQETVRVLASFGTFIEIGKTDAMSRHQVNIHDFLNNGTYIFFDMDRYFAQRETCVGWIHGMLDYVEKGILKPPPTEEFTLKDIGKAIRKLSAAKHIGKIILQFHQQDGSLLPSCRQIPYVPQCLFLGDASYVLLGGTGGLGLSIANWMVEHGARHLLLLSRTARVQQEDQLLLDNLLSSQCEVKLQTVDITDQQSLSNCLDTWLTDHPSIHGVFHTAMVLQDGLIQSLSNDQIERSLAVKVKGGWNIHNYCESHHINLDFFIVFSSIASIVGNLGQSNYCIGNMALEGLIHYRRSHGMVGTVLNLAGVYDAGAVARDSSILNASLKNQMISKVDVLHCLQQLMEHQSYLTSSLPGNRQELPRQLILFPFEENPYLLHELPILQTLEWSLTTNSIKADALIKQVASLPISEQKQAITTSIKKDLATILGMDETFLKVDQALSSLGIDSILAVELKNKLDSQWNMSLPVFELTSGKSVGDLINTVSSHVEKQAENTSTLSSANQRALNTELLTIDSILQSSPLKQSTRIEDNVLDLFKSMKSKLQISTDFAERFDWTTTHEALETRLYLSQLPWNPYFFTQEKKSSTVSEVEGMKHCINFTSYDYLGLCNENTVVQAAEDALKKYGTSVSASRLAGGQIPLHSQLEHAIASFLGVEACIVMLGGHTCNVNTIKCLLNRRDLIVYDELAHNSIIEGAVYSGASRLAFKHNDHQDLNRILREHRCEYEKVLICIEGVYSMDGDIPDLPQFIQIKQRYNCILYVDEAHSIGVLGKTGRGIGEYYGIDMTMVDLWMGSLGKAFASAGGYIAGSAVAIEILRYRAPGFVYSIGIPPPNTAAALAAIQLAQQQPWRVNRLREKTTLFKKLCLERGIDIYDSMKSTSAVIPVKCGSTERCIEVMRRLRQHGVLVTAGMYPAVESGNARLRFFINANHEEKDIKNTVEAVSETLEETKLM